jgi:hypothetical protein
MRNDLALIFHSINSKAGVLHGAFVLQEPSRTGTSRFISSRAINKKLNAVACLDLVLHYVLISEPPFFAIRVSINQRINGAYMNSNLDKFFKGVGEGFLQSSSQESRQRDVAFVGREKRSSREKLVRHQKINESAKTVTVIVSIWIVIFLGIVIAAMMGR